MKKTLKIIAITLGALFIGSLSFLVYMNPSFGWTFSDSMYPTYQNGDIDVTFHNETPKIGDVVAYTCINKERCQNEYGMRIAHRLTSVDAQGCMTIIGDNPKYDWSKLPCYMPEDIEIIGVNHKL